MTLTMIPMFGILTSAAETESITVYLTVNNRGEFAMAEDGTIMAEKAILVTDIDGDGQYSFDEALVAAHAAYNSEDGYSAPGGYVSRLWGVDTYNCLFFINDAGLTTGVTGDFVENGDYLVASINADDAYYSDFYSFFTTPVIYLEVGMEAKLDLRAYGGMMGGDPIALEGASIGCYTKDGNYTDLGITTDEQGVFTISVDEPGIYYVTASAEVKEQVVTDWNLMNLGGDPAVYGTMDWTTYDSFVAYTEEDYGDGPYPADEVKYIDFFDWKDLEDEDPEAFAAMYTLHSNSVIVDSPIIVPCMKLVTWFPYDGDEVSFIDGNGSPFGMLSLQDGSYYYLDGDTVVIHDVPSNGKVYGGFVFYEDIDSIAAGQTAEQTNLTVVKNEDNTLDIILPAYFCGSAIPIAPVKGADRGGGTTSKQYYLAIPAAEKLTYTIDAAEVNFIKKDGSGFGMFTSQNGSYVKVNGDNLDIHVVPKNKTVYNGLHFGLITDDELTKDVEFNADGSFDFSVPMAWCGSAIPIAPVKKSDGSTTSAQYYLTIPTREALDFAGATTGVAKAANGIWYYLKDGAVMYAETTVQKNDYGWWYLDNGKVDFDYTGFGPNEYGWWYVEKGQVKFNKTDIIQGIANNDGSKAGEDGWWLVEKSQVMNKTTVAQNAYGWWKVDEGKVDFEFTGLADNQYGWWYLEDGKVDFNYTGFADNENGWWYVEKGQIKFNKNDIIQGIANNEAGKEGEDGWWLVEKSQVVKKSTIAQNAYGWWKVEEGKVNFEFTGLADNQYGWWYLKDGKVDFTFTGFEPNENGWWYVEKGQITFKKNDVIHGMANDYTTKPAIDGWWYVRNSVVTLEPVTTVAQNAYGWWYIHFGQVDFSYNGVGHNDYGNWYIKNGKVDFTFNGPAYGYIFKEGKAISKAAE